MAIQHDSAERLMWFDLVLIDRIFADGTMESAHIRAENADRIPVDRLEDIDREYRDIDSADIGGIRIYQKTRMRTATLRSKLRNFDVSETQMLVQLEHFGLPLHSGYYAVVFPKQWRIVEIHVYDPYHPSEDVVDKRKYRCIDLLWDPSSALSCAQFNMQAARLGTFSLGLIAALSPAETSSSTIDRIGAVDVAFSDIRHHGHPDELGYRHETANVIEVAKSERPKMPAINVSLSGPSLNIVDWARYLRDKIRKVRR